MWRCPGRLRRWLPLTGLLLACTPSPEPKGASADPAQGTASPRPQPKPGERVRQPELDAYCGDQTLPEAFYYHGGRPVVKVAREDGCKPLFVSDCTQPADCERPGEQEAGMWCCAASASAAAEQLREAHATSPH